VLLFSLLQKAILIDYFSFLLFSSQESPTTHSHPAIYEVHKQLDLFVQFLKFFKHLRAGHSMLDFIDQAFFQPNLKIENI
jgi:hypothetical protein